MAEMSSRLLREGEEEGRLAALRRYEILDTAPEPAFDDIVALASRLCGVPIALVVLIDETRAWMKAGVGIPLSAIPRDLAFCKDTIRQRAMLVHEDLSGDPRFSDNPLVAGPLGVRFYAGAPLVTNEGFAIGTLCVLDSQPHTLTEVQRLALSVLRDQVMAQIELRQQLTQALSLSEELEGRVLDRTRALYEENMRRCAAEGELRALSLRLLSIQEEERTRLAREVHDNLGQELTALSMSLHRLTRLTAQTPDCLDVVASMEQTIQETIESVRRIARELRPAALDDLGLVSAIRCELKRVADRADLRATLCAQEGIDAIPREHATALYRIFQEALTNIVRHADARHVEVLLRKEDRALDMTIRDDGIGVDPEVAKHSTSLGLIGIRERAHQLGGVMSLMPHPDGGTLLRVTLPTTQLREGTECLAS